MLLWAGCCCADGNCFPPVAAPTTPAVIWLVVTPIRPTSTQTSTCTNTKGIAISVPAKRNVHCRLPCIGQFAYWPCEARLLVVHTGHQMTENFYASNTSLKLALACLEIAPVLVLGFGLGKPHLQGHSSTAGGQWLEYKCLSWPMSETSDWHQALLSMSRTTTSRTAPPTCGELLFANKPHRTRIHLSLWSAADAVPCM